MHRIVTGLLLVLVLAAAVGCNQAPAPGSQPSQPSQSKVTTVEGIYNAFKGAGIPVTQVEIYTAETDPNEFLGRPGQYTAKASWADSRLEQVEGDLRGGTVELFQSQGDLQERKAYIEAIDKAFPFLMEYTYARGSYLLRLDHGLTPVQAAEYEKVLEDLNL